ncbi:hypothetical protein SAMN04487884_10754 [Butyrivibrio fibrisolvens]|uniref:Glucosyl transferase GtrII n=1 Tax=Butyrivibrio fibrisolvens TaxID=831 RepID=A0A1H9Q6T9_BUTFI|nr:DUF6056 family protein [Butyrivibrio fibrisolvens]SER56160.1 hypothetical protein SAMN04487884_10754 [Butyrivibrio fibrisolvens]
MHVLNLDAKWSKKLFILEVIACYLTILMFMILTPLLGDDFNYYAIVNKADSFWDLFAQEYDQYMHWTGRSVAHIILRLVFYFDSVMLFNVLSAAVFVILTLCIYFHIDRRNEYDYRLYLFIVLMIWVFGTAFAETILLKYASCNYLITTGIIFVFLTLYRRWLIEGSEGGILRCIGMFLLGIVAGWCSENTSGGAILLIMIYFAIIIYNRKHAAKNISGDSSLSLAMYGTKIMPWMMTGFVGLIIGFAFMILAPGNYVRASYIVEEHSGIVGMIARIQKTTLLIRDNFLILICMFIVILIILRVMGRSFIELHNMLMYGFLFLATAYSLIMTAEPQGRAFFGAGIFLTIAICQGFSDIKLDNSTDLDKAFYTAGSCLVAIMFVYMFFEYIDSGADLGRIYREESERDAYLTSKAQEGDTDVYAPMLRPDFENKYTFAYELDITDNPEYWTNVEVEAYYGMKSIIGVERENWTEY